MVVENDRLKGWNLGFGGAGLCHRAFGMGRTGNTCMHCMAGGRKIYYTWSPMQSGWPGWDLILICVSTSTHVYVWHSAGRGEENWKRACSMSSPSGIGCLRVDSRMWITIVIDTRFMSGRNMRTHATDVTLTLK